MARALSLIVFLLGSIGASAQPGTLGSSIRASALQRYFGYSANTFPEYQFIATHNSYSNGALTTTHSTLEKPSQIYSITDQLQCLGVRGLEIDAHYVDSLASLRVCHTSDLAASDVYDACSYVSWDACNSCSIIDFGPEDTLCREDSPTFNSVMQEVANWLAQPETVNEMLYVKLELYVGDFLSLVSDDIGATVGFNQTFTNADLVAAGGVWPSVDYLVHTLGKRVAFLSSDSTGDSVVIPISETRYYPVDITVLLTQGGRWGETFGFSRVQGVADLTVLTPASAALFNVEDENVDELTPDLVYWAILTGLTPTFEFMDATYLDASIWSWQQGSPREVVNASVPLCTHFSLTAGARWVDVECSDITMLPFACNDSPLGIGAWNVSTVAGYASDAPTCGGTTPYFAAPVNSINQFSLAAAMTAVGVADVWINVGTDAAGCWSSNDGVGYCLPSTWNDQMCGNGVANPPVQPVVDSNCLTAIQAVSAFGDTVVNVASAIQDVGNGVVDGVSNGVKTAYDTVNGLWRRS